MSVQRATVLRRLRRLVRDRSGVAASEFALILPVLILLLFGVVEIGNLVLLDRKVTAAAQTAADLVAQSKVVTSTDISNVWSAIDSIIEPYNISGARYDIASVVADAGGATSIDWQQTHGESAFATINVPANLLSPGDSVIVATITYAYTPVFGDVLLGPFDITEVAYLRPRTVDKVEYQ